MKITMRLLMMLLPLAAMTAFATPAPTDQQCKDAWKKSESATLSYCKLLSAQGSLSSGKRYCIMTVENDSQANSITSSSYVLYKTLPHVKNCNLNTSGDPWPTGETGS